MNHETLRVFFESLCDYLEGDAEQEAFHFQGGFGFESPHEVVMVFVFDQITLVFRFPADPFDLEEPSLLTKSAISVDDVLSLSHTISTFSGGFADLFSSPSTD